MANNSDYGCIRFNNSVFSRIATDVGNRGCLSADGTIHSIAFEAAEQSSSVYVESTLDTYAGEIPPESIILARAFSQLVLLHALYVSAGRQVFQFTPAILNEFKRTDVSETPVGRLNLPYPAGFLHFGRQFDLELNDQWRVDAEYLDGAYFHCGPSGFLSIQLTLSRRDGNWSKLPGPYFFVQEEMLDLPAHEAIDKVLDTDAALFNDSQHKDAMYDALQEWDKASRPMLHAALSLILNALFYLDAYGADTEAAIPEDTPHKLKSAYEKAVKSSSRKAIREAKHGLMAEGFTVIRMCGVEIGKHDERSQSDETGTNVRTHWRRGHWRMQTCGPQLSQTKRVWIRPTLVGKHAASPVQGHKYVVGPAYASDENT
jgi:hypothetical protein